MKRTIKILLLTFCCTMQVHLVAAQAAELAQLALDIEKLAQLKSILTDMKKTYDIVAKGYGTIKDLSEGNFNIHDAFLDALMQVSPEVRKYRKVADIISYQGSILKEYKAAFNRFRQSGLFTPQEIDYMSRVYGNLFDESLQQLDELSLIITAGKLRMSDEERISGIDRVYDDMAGKLAFLRQFNRKANTLQSSRQQANIESDAARTIQGLP